MRAERKRLSDEGEGEAQQEDEERKVGRRECEKMLRVRASIGDESLLM